MVKLMVCCSSNKWAYCHNPLWKLGTQFTCITRNPSPSSASPRLLHHPERRDWTASLVMPPVAFPVSLSLSYSFHTWCHVCVMLVASWWQLAGLWFTDGQSHSKWVIPAVSYVLQIKSAVASRIVCQEKFVAASVATHIQTVATLNRASSELCDLL